MDTSILHILYSDLLGYHMNLLLSSSCSSLFFSINLSLLGYQTVYIKKNHSNHSNIWKVAWLNCIKKMVAFNQIFRFRDLAGLALKNYLKVKRSDRF